MNIGNLTSDKTNQHFITVT